jgi:N-acetylneuraminic acid mutarotase
MPSQHALSEANVYVFGGCDEEDNDHASVFKFDTEANEWSILAQMPYASGWHCTSVLDGWVYIIGAETGNEILRFDPVSGAWVTLAPTLSNIFGAASFVVGGNLYAVGGMDHSSNTERYDVASNTWVEVADMLEERKLYGAVTIGLTGPAEEQDLFDSLIAKASSRHL